MTQDRTRAIVEAAERLGRAIDEEALHGEDPPPLVVAARLDLARALSIPCLPEAESDFCDAGSPESMHRNAGSPSAWRYSCAACGWSVTKIGVLQPFKGNCPKCNSWKICASPEHLPAPQWTRTPPSEPGLYYLRGPGDAFNGAAGEIRTSVAEVRMLGHRDVLGVWLLPSQCRDEAFLALDRMPDGFEWWPVRVEEPPA